MQMNRRLRTGTCRAILLTLLLMTLQVIHATAAHDHATRDGSVSAKLEVSAGQSGAVRPIGHSVGVDAVAFTPDGTLIASGNVDNLVRLWQTQTGQGWRALTGHSRGVAVGAFASRQ